MALVFALGAGGCAGEPSEPGVEAEGRVTAALGAAGVGSPAATMLGDVLVATADRKLSAFSTRDGSPRWVAALEARPVAAPDGSSFVATSAGLVALGPDGERRWAVTSRGGFVQPALGAGGALFAVDGLGRLVAVDAAGRVRWALPLGGAPAVPPILDAELRIYVATADGRLHAVSDQGDSGEVRWVAELGARAAAPLLLAPGGLLVVPLADGSIAGMGPPLTGHRPTCEAWLADRGASAACLRCEAEVDACLGDTGCARLAACLRGSTAGGVR